MNWQQSRLHHPHQWLLIEAVQAHTEADHRMIDDLAVISAYPDSTAARLRPFAPRRPRARTLRRSHGPRGIGHHRTLLAGHPAKRMNLRLQDGLPFVEVTLDDQGQRLVLPEVLLDTGSTGSLFAADELLKIKVCLEPHDPLRRIRGVGGSEFGAYPTLLECPHPNIRPKVKGQR